MKLIDLIRTGLQNLWRRRLRSFLTIVAVLIGSTAVVALLILAFGVRDVFLGQLEASGLLNRITVIGDADAEVSLTGDNSESEDGSILTEEMVETFATYPHVDAVTPVIGAYMLEHARLKDGNNKRYRMDVQGIRPDPAFDLTLSAGRNLRDNQEDMYTVVMANQHLEDFGFENADEVIGETIIFSTYEGYQGALSEPRPWDADNEEWETRQEFEAEIIGVTAPGPTESTSYITEAWAYQLRSRLEYSEPTDEERERVEQLNQELSGQAWQEGREPDEEDYYQPEPELITTYDIDEEGFDNIHVQVDTADNVAAVADQIESNYDVGAITAQEFLDQILSIFTIVSIVLGAIGGIALLVAAVGIINTMVMAVMERTKEIGIMKAVGASKSDIRRLFVFEAGLLGFWGGLFGLGAGFGLTVIANYFVNDQLAGEGFAATNIATLPWWLGIGVVVFTTVVGIAAGLYPAVRAARMNPVDALRRE